LLLLLEVGGKIPFRVLLAEAMLSFLALRDRNPVVELNEPNLVAVGEG
jgi:hypothetical protein